MLIAIKTIEVGVDTFSLTLKSKLSMEKEQISTPLPVIAEKIPPRKPVRSKTTACQMPKLGMESYVFLLCSLKLNDWCNVNQILKNYILKRTLGGFICTFSLLISLSITLRTSKFRNQFTISSKPPIDIWIALTNSECPLVCFASCSLYCQQQLYTIF